MEEVDVTPEILAQMEAQELLQFEKFSAQKFTARCEQIVDRMFDVRLREDLHKIAKPYQELARELLKNSRPNADLMLALEALEASKDSAVRANL